MAKARNLAVDIGRLIAATGVIILHLTPSTPMGENFNTLFWIFCVPFFVTTSLYFFVKSAVKSPPTRSPFKKIDRLVIPYLVWSLIYVVMRYVKFQLQGEGGFGFDVIGLIFYGTAAVQLYFIPWIICFRLQFFCGRLMFFSGRHWKNIMLGTLGMASLFGFAWYGGFEGYFSWGGGIFWLGILYSLAALFLVGLERSGLLKNSWVRWGAIASFIAVEITNYFTYTQAADNLFLKLGLPVLGGLSSTLIALTFSATSHRQWLVGLLSTTYGIYLAHHAVIEVFEFAGGRVGLELQPYDIVEKLLFGAVVLAATIALILLVRLSRRLAYVVLGDVA